MEQAGTELGQDQLQLELGFTLIEVCCITRFIFYKNTFYKNNQAQIWKK